MTLRIERDKLYRARNGHVWRVVCLDAGGSYPVLAIKDPGGSVRWFCANGQAGSDGSFDLIEEYTPPQKPREWWFNPNDRDYFLVGPQNSSDKHRPRGFIRVREVMEGE